MQVNLWIDIKKAFQGKFVFPIAKYYADFNIGNGIGSHKKKNNKLGAVYYTLPCFPPEIQKFPELIFTTMMFHSKIRKISSSKNIFIPFVEELSNLESKALIFKLRVKMK